MKKIISLIMATVVAAAMAAIGVSASALYPADGCEILHYVKKANSADVIKDGIIGENEYTEIEINRDFNTTDLMFSFEKASAYGNLEEFLNNVHFYMSWDEVHGLNVAGKATLLETPHSESTMADSNCYAAGDEFPGDEFLFQFGMMFKVVDENGVNVVNRGLSKNTVTGDILLGYYYMWDYNELGYDGSLNQTEGVDYTVSIDGNTVTYEMSFPLSTVLHASYINGNAPEDQAEMLFDHTLIGGSKGIWHSDDCEAYAISVGDYGYIHAASSCGSPAHATAIFTNESIAPESSNNGNGTNGTTGNTGTEGTTAPETEVIVNEDGTTTTITTNKDGSTTTTVTDKDGNVTSTTTNKAPQTGDPMVFAAVASALSACGIAVARRRRNG